MKNFLILYCVNLVLGSDPLVQIEQGIVRGKKSDDETYKYFLGIPYAKVDENNPFGPAIPHPKFEKPIFEADNGTISCPATFSFNTQQQILDCLRLNIYVPSEANPKSPLPVLIWIHGGGFSGGNAGSEGFPYLVRHGIIVVLINYRLGPYGFLCLDSPSVPGNQGLKDQYEAIRWVKNNIGAFGGNSDEITIGGLSAGSDSAILHLYSTQEKLFKKVIAHSGVPQVDGMFAKADANAAIKLATHLGFNSTNTDQALDFLTKTPFESVINSFKELNLFLRPCKEKSFVGVENFIDKDPYSMTNERKIKNTPILIGDTLKEEEFDFKDPHHNGEDYVKNPFHFRIKRNFILSDEELQKAVDFVRHFYIGDDAVSEEVLAELKNFDADFLFHHSIQRTIKKLLDDNANPVFNYVFTYNNGKRGPTHGADGAYLFRHDFALDQCEDDKLMSDRMTTMWANFIRIGNPTPKATGLVPVIWEPVNTTTKPYMVLDLDIALKHRPYQQRMAFWDIFYSIYEKYNYLISHDNDS